HPATQRLPYPLNPRSFSTMKTHSRSAKFQTCPKPVHTAQQGKEMTGSSAGALLVSLQESEPFSTFKLGAMLLTIIVLCINPNSLLGQSYRNRDLAAKISTASVLYQPLMWVG